MKNIFLILCVIVLTGCVSKVDQPDRWFKWSAIDLEADSLVRKLEQSYAESWSLDLRKKILSQLDSITVVKNHDQLFARLYYWKAHFLRDSSIDSVDYYLSKAQKINNEVDYPYDTHRLNSLKMTLPNRNLFESYMSTLEDVTYYQSIGDSIMWAASLGHLGVDLNSIGYIQEALEYLKESNELFTLLGMENIVRKNLLNVAISNVAISPEVADSVLSILREEMREEDSDNFKCLVFLNSFTLTKDSKYLDTVDNILSNTKGMEFFRLKSMAKRLAAKRRENVLDESFYNYLDSAMSLAKALPSHPYVPEILNLASERDYGNGNFRSAYILKSRALELYDSLTEVERVMEIIKNESKMQIEKIRTVSNLRQKEERLTYYSIIISIIALALGGILIFHRILRQSISKRRKAEVHLDHKEKQLSVTRVVLEESDKMIDKMRQSFVHLQEKNKIDHPTVVELDRQCRSFKVIRDSLEISRDLSDNLDLGFTENLKRSVPDITDSQIVLANYILLGLSSKQIAMKMGIAPDSVKKSRYRLRSKLGLTSQESLEEKLRSIKEKGV